MTSVLAPPAVTEDRERCGAPGRTPVSGGWTPLPACHPPRAHPTLHAASLSLPRPSAAGVFRNGEQRTVDHLSREAASDFSLAVRASVLSKLHSSASPDTTVPLTAATASLALPPQPPALLPVSRAVQRPVVACNYHCSFECQPKLLKVPLRPHRCGLMQIIITHLTQTGVQTLSFLSLALSLCLSLSLPRSV